MIYVGVIIIIVRIIFVMNRHDGDSRCRFSLFKIFQFDFEKKQRKNPSDNVLANATEE